jgi:hypothetical protein
VKQSGILQKSYEGIYQILANLGAELGLFSVENGHLDKRESTKEGPKTVVLLEIADISQLAKDKNGQEIIVDEVSYEEPSRIGFIVSITAISDQYPDMLEALGAIIRHFKDDNTIPIGDFGWHGSTDGLVYIEPIIREPGSGKNRASQASPALALEYRVEVAINSENGTRVKRVERQRIRSNVMDGTKKA